MKKNKVLIFEPFKLDGGQEKFALGLYESLKLRFDVDLLIENNSNIHIQKYISNELKALSNYPISNLIDEYDIIFLNGDRALYLFLKSYIFSSKKNYCKIIHIKHLKFTDATRNLPFFRRIIYRMAHNFLIHQVDDLIAISKPIYTHYCKKGHRVKLIENGIIPILNSEVKRTSKKIKVGFIGRLDFQKGIKLIRDAAIFFSARTDVEFIIYGQGPLSSILMNIPNIKLIGFTNDISVAYAGMDIVLMPSLYEGLSLSLLESMSAGKLLVLSDIESFRSVLDNNSALFFESGNSKSFIQTLKYAIENLSVLTILPLNARKIFEDHYSFEKMVSKYVELIEFYLNIEKNSY